MGGFGNYAFQTYLDELKIETGFYDYDSKSSIFTLRALRKVYKKLCRFRLLLQQGAYRF